jgi:hypothetical protein
MGLVAVALVLAGFGPGLFADPASRRGAPTTAVMLHALVFGLWLLLYLTQTVLVRHDSRALHRRLGWVGVPLAVCVVIVGYMTATAQGRRGFALWWDPSVTTNALEDMVHPLGDLLTFSILVTAAILGRRRPEAHKRFMLLATIGSMMAAPVAHIMANFPALRDTPVILLPLALLYFSSAIYDRVAHGRIHPVSLWGGLALFAFANVRAAVIGPSAAWHRFAQWLVQ